MFIKRLDYCVPNIDTVTSTRWHVSIFLIVVICVSALPSINAQSVTLPATNSSNTTTSPGSCGVCREDEYCDNATRCRRCVDAISLCTRCNAMMTSSQTVTCFACDGGQPHPDGSQCDKDSQTMYIIIGCVIGGVVLIVFLAIVIICCALKHCRRKRTKKQPLPPPTKADLEQHSPTTYENIGMQRAPTKDELQQGHDNITRYSRDPTTKEKRQSALMQMLRRKNKHSDATSSHQQHPSSTSHPPSDDHFEVVDDGHSNDMITDGLPDEDLYDNQEVLTNTDPPLPLPVTSHSSDSSSDDDEDGKPKKPDYVNVAKLGDDYENVPDVKKSTPATKKPDYVNEEVIAKLVRESTSEADYLPMNNPGAPLPVVDRRRGAGVGDNGGEAPRREGRITRR